MFAYMLMIVVLLTAYDCLPAMKLIATYPQGCIEANSLVEVDN